MIIHLFNSSLVSGPETLAIPAFNDLQKELQTSIEVWNLAETRKNEAAKSPLEYARGFGLKTFEIKIEKRFDREAIKVLAFELDRKKPSIVHAHDVKASIYLALANLRLKFQQKEPVWKSVTTHHGIHARNGAAVRMYEWVYRFLFLPFFDRVLTVCSTDRKILLRQGLSKKRVLNHLNGVDRISIPPDHRMKAHQNAVARWEQEFSIDLKNKIIFGVAARLSPEKNHDLLLDALKILKEKNQQWVCLCFGVGALDAELRAKTTASGLDSWVRWGGYRKNLSNEMIGFDVLLSFSIGEGLPINLLEAGWAGTPILATRVDGVNDLVPEADPSLRLSGLAANPHVDDVVKRLLMMIENPSIRTQLGSTFQSRVETSFSGVAWKNRLKEIYRGLHD